MYRGPVPAQPLERIFGVTSFELRLRILESIKVMFQGLFLFMFRGSKAIHKT
jgi:hypothetical protein